MVTAMIISFGVLVFGIVFMLAGPVDKVFVGAAISLAGAIMALVFAFCADQQRAEICHKAGGVLVRTTCVDPKAIINI